jgi:hypothetical protein
MVWGALSKDRIGLSAGPRYRSHSPARVPRDSWSYFTDWGSGLHQAGRPGLRIYVLQEEGGPLLPSRTWFPFRRLLHLAAQRLCIRTRFHASRPKRDFVDFLSLYRKVQRVRKDMPATGRGGLQGCEMLRISHCLDNQLADCVRLSALRTGHALLPRKSFWYSFVLEAESTPVPKCG